MDRLRFLAGLAVAAALLSGCSRAQAADAQLLSLTPPPLAVGEYVDGFTVRTQGVEILAVCHIPFGWKTTAGIEDSVTGELSGEAGLGPSFLSARSANLGQLDGLFLVRIQPGQGDEGLPPTFDASMTVGRYGDEAADRTVALDASKVILAPAAQCPPPRR